MTDLCDQIADALAKHPDWAWSAERGGVYCTGCDWTLDVPVTVTGAEVWRQHQADTLLPLVLRAKAGAWQEGWNQGFRDLQAGRYADGYMEVTPTPNPYRADNLEASHE